jgi:hypothetical protein
MNRDNITRIGARTSRVEGVAPRMAVHYRACCSDTVPDIKRGHGMHERQMQTSVSCEACLVQA